MLTVKNALELEVFNGARLLAGKKGLDSPIAAVTVLEVTSDDIAVWAKDDELWITSFYSIANDVDRQIHILNLLHSKKASGIVVCSIGYFFPEVSTRLIAAAEAVDMPLILMPAKTTYEEVIQALMCILLCNQKEELAEALQVQRTMSAMALRRKNIHALLEFLESVFQKQILFFNNKNQLIHPKRHIEIQDQRLRSMISQSIFPQQTIDENRFLFQEGCVYFPVASPGYYYGSIVIPWVNQSEAGRYELILTNAAASLMLVSASEKSSLWNNEAAASRFFQKLQSGELTNVFEIQECAQEAGLDLRKKHYLGLIEGSDLRDRWEALQQLFKKDHPHLEMVLFDRRILFLCPCETPEEGADCLNRLEKSLDIAQSRLTASEHSELRIGVSLYFDTVAQLGSACQQASLAILIGKTLFPQKLWLSCHNLGIYLMLCQHYRMDREGQSVQNSLQLLQQYDNQYHSQYLCTLKTLFWASGGVEAIAGRMHIHKNTLLYRKNKIIHLLGHDPFSMPKLLDYQIYFAAERLCDGEQQE